jgi:PAS domain S-box-containing protein
MVKSSATKKELLEEVSALKKKIRKLEKPESRRKHTEDTLRESEEKYRNLFDNANEAIFVAQDGRIVFTNPMAYIITGYSREEIASMSYADFIYPDDRDMVIDRHLRRMKGEDITQRYSFRLIHKDGGIRWANLNTVRINWKEAPAILSFMTDITESKLVEAYLLASEERFQSLFNNMSGGVAVYKTIDYGEHFILVDINKSGEKLSRVSRSEIIGKGVEKVFPGIKEMGLLDVFKQVWKTGKPQNHPVSLYYDNHHVQWFENYVYKLPSGEIVAVYDDVTERKQAEESVRNSEEKFSKAFEKSPLLMTISSIEDGTYIDINEKFTEVSGFKKEEAIGKTSVELGWLKSQDRERLIRDLKMNGYIENIELELQNKDKRKIICQYYGDLITIGGQQYLLSIAQDITEPKQVENELRQSEERFRKIFEEAHLGIVIVSPSFKFEKANSAFCSMMGYSADELFSMTFADITHPDYIRQDVENVKKVGSGEIAFYKTEKPYIHKNGKLIWADVVVSGVRDDQGALRYYLATIIDITERRQSEELLRVSEDNFRRTLDESPLGVRIVTLEGKTLYANSAILDIYGYESTEELEATPVEKRYTHASYAEYKIRWEKRKRGDVVPSDYNIDIIRKDGEVRHLQVYRKQILWNGARQDQAIYQDITERKKMDESLKESEQKFIVAFNANPIPAAISTMKEGRFLNVNDAFVKSFSYSSKTELIGKTSVELGLFANPSDRQSMRKDVEETGKVTSRESQMVTKDGRMLDLLFSAVPVLISNQQCLLTSAVDITARNQAESQREAAHEALNHSREQYRSLVKNIKDVVFTVDLQGTFTFISPVIESMSGYTSEEVIGMHFSFFAHPDDLSGLAEAFAQTVSGGSVSHEFRVYDKTGAVRWVVTKSRLVAEDGNTPVITGLMSDITKHKQAEEEKQLLEERLMRAEKMEALGLLAGGVAHDLNNVLGIVVGYAELLLNTIDAKNPIREDLVTIMEGGQRAAAIVQDMLTLARRGVTGRKVLNLNKLVSDFKKSPDWNKLLSYNPDVKINIDLDPDLLNISGSSVHLVKTLYNLVSNATEAMTKGGTVNIKTNNQYIDKPIVGYDTIREGDYVVLSVSDEGEGISETDLKRIFEPFYTKKIMGRSGTGLGLSVVWGTVKDHQGYIDVQSEEGKGTTFTLYFQITREDITAEASAVSMSEYLGKGESILVIDDVKKQRDLASRMLKSLNYNVASASSGEDAVEYLKDHKIDLLVLDMIMDPGMDGLDTYKSVLKINQKQKAIIVSGFSESDRVYDAQALGAGAYVKKPYVIEKLGMAVKKELGKG